ncbi:armadillo-type protein [Lineolata rhizophorae]|uniref:Armadillo-type protein n=1 Tax=Lineolata rhizophorae TaxID=578093 RepID=A0A6A6NP64_9PEZI|nr:armadillo-type protein [Lineolata rhizophorae]
MAHAASTPQTITALLPKLHDADADFRYMALADLHQTLLATGPSQSQVHIVTNDSTLYTRLSDGLLHTLADSNGEVQNMAVKCLGPFATKVPAYVLSSMIDRIAGMGTKGGGGGGTTGQAVDESIPALALRAIVVALPKPVQGTPPTKATQDAYAAISCALIPRLVGGKAPSSASAGKSSGADKSGTGGSTTMGMLPADVAHGTDSNAIDVLTETARCFGPLLHRSEVDALQRSTLEVLESARTSSVLKKKAVVAMAALAPYFSQDLLSRFVSTIVERLRQPHLTSAKRKVYLTLLGSVARAVPRRFGPYLKVVGEFVLAAVSQAELDEELEAREEDDDGERNTEVDDVHEAALVAIEGFLLFCKDDMKSFLGESLDAALRFLKYNPNFTGDDEDGDETMGVDDEDNGLEGLEGDDFEEEQGFDDDEDSSWKVRRCAAKVLSAIVTTRSDEDLLEDATLYERVAPILISRFKEREESVRLEVLSTLSLLIRRTSEMHIVSSSASTTGQTDASMMPPPPAPSRKRRRGASDASMFDAQAAVIAASGTGFASPVNGGTPITGPRAALAKLSSLMVTGVAGLLRSSPSPTKQASLVLLRDVVVTQRGGLDEYLEQIMGPIADAIKASEAQTSGSSLANANGLRVCAMQLLGVIAETHSSKNVQPFMGSIVPALVSAIKDRMSKVSIEALAATEQVIKALTPPRALASGDANKDSLAQLYSVIMDRIRTSYVDIEVREKAIAVLGLLLGRTAASPGLVTPDQRKEGLDLLADRLRNEVTRLAAVRAIDVVIALADDKSQFEPAWVRAVALELGAQTRKANRGLRSAAVAALKTLAVNKATRDNLDAESIGEVVGMLPPILESADFYLVSQALVILSTFVRADAAAVVDAALVKRVADIVASPLSGPVVSSLLGLVEAIGEMGQGGPLMNSLLRGVGVNGNPDLVGKTVGTLLVAGASSVGVSLDDFVKELKGAADDVRRCLALAVLGEAALRLGKRSPLEPGFFMGYFDAKGSDKVALAAAVALGRAAAGDPERFVPEVVGKLERPRTAFERYLALNSVKEMLTHADGEEAGAGVVTFGKDLWKVVMEASQEGEDNRAIGAECVGRLAVLEPGVYLPELEGLLKDPSPGVRGLVISALRFTFADTDEAYDDHLRADVVGMLTAMLNDNELENRRMALSTVNAALRNKPHLVVPALGGLAPLVLGETEVRPELVREVAMGPFKIKVDDGLELRKSAYETLNALLDAAFPRLSLLPVFDRILAGVADDHNIRTLCLHMLTRLSTLAPDATRSVLNTLSGLFRTVLQTKPKENAVKQEVERVKDSANQVLRTTLVLQMAFGVADQAGPAGVGGGAGVPVGAMGASSLGAMGTAGGAAEADGIRDWVAYWEWCRREMEQGLRSAERELKEKGA